MPADSAQVTFTRAGVRRGLARGNGFALGVLVFGIAFGLVANQAGLSTVQAMLFSLLVFSASAQLAALGVMSAGISGLAATAWTVLVLILVINARYVLFSATMRPWLSQVSPFQAYTTLFFLGDGSWMIAMRAYGEGERDAGFVFGASIISGVTWVAGTGIGSVAGSFAPNPRDLGLDFMLVAFSAAMMTLMFRGRRDLGVVAIAAGVAVLLERAGQSAWAPVGAGLAGGAVAFLRVRGDENGKL